MLSKARRIVNVSVLPGEPLNGTGRVCIHLFVPDEKGPIVEPHVLHPSLDEQEQPIKQRVKVKPTRGRLACDPKRQVTPVTKNGVTRVTPRTDDPRAVSCEKCKASREYKALLFRIENPDKITAAKLNDAPADVIADYLEETR